MSKLMIFQFTNLLFSFILNNDFNAFKRRLDSIYYRIEESLPREDEVKYLLNDAEELLSDLEYFLKRNEGISSTERPRLLELEKEIEVLISFFDVIDKNNGQMEKVDFIRILDKIGGEVISISTNGSCAQILKIQIGEYKALFFENITKSISYKLAYEFLDKRYNLVSQKGEMGLIRRNVRLIENSRDDEGFEHLKFKSLSCVEFDYPF